MRTREACESLRFLVFGTAGNDSKRVRDGGGPHEQRCGTREEVMQLHRVWDEMDEDGSGDVEFQEFLNFFSRSKADRLLGMRCVNYLVGKAKFEGHDEREVGCTVQDMMKLLWLKATDADMERMMHWFYEAEYQRDRVPTPPLLPQRKRREILENFPSLNWGPSGRLSFHKLMEHSLVDEATMQSLWDSFGPRTSISENELLEMLCPNGYRAHAAVKSAVDKHGRPLVHVSNEYFTGWLLAEGESKWTVKEEDLPAEPPAEPPAELPGEFPEELAASPEAPAQAPAPPGPPPLGLGLGSAPPEP